MSPEEFRRFGHQLIDWISDFHAGAGARSVMASVAPGAVKALLPKEAPIEPEPMDVVLRDFAQIVPPGLTDWQNPRFFGYFPSNALPSGMLGDMLATGLGVLGLTWQSSPAVTEIEEVVTDWVRRMVGLSDEWSGVIQDTASTNTLVALICAREVATQFALARGGLQACEQPLSVYLSAQSHSSVEKAALLAGFGRENLRFVPLDDAHAMRTDAFAAMVAADLSRGIVPCALVATIGTTATTAVDPLAALAPIAARARMWLHVDAAMGAAP